MFEKLKSGICCDVVKSWTDKRFLCLLLCEEEERCVGEESTKAGISEDEVGLRSVNSTFGLVCDSSGFVTLLSACKDIVLFFLNNPGGMSHTTYCQYQAPVTTDLYQIVFLCRVAGLQLSPFAGTAKRAK